MIFKEKKKKKTSQEDFGEFTTRKSVTLEAAEMRTKEVLNVII